MSDEVDVAGVINIDQLIAKTSKDGETIIRISERVAIRFHERAGWHVMDVMTLTNDLKNAKGEDVGGILVDAPIGEQQLNQIIQVLQARRLRR